MRKKNTLTTQENCQSFKAHSTLLYGSQVLITSLSED